jgi:hypothetical protein
VDQIKEKGALAQCSPDGGEGGRGGSNLGGCSGFLVASTTKRVRGMKEDATMGSGVERRIGARGLRVAPLRLRRRRERKGGWGGGSGSQRQGRKERGVGRWRGPGKGGRWSETGEVAHGRYGPAGFELDPQ